MPIPNAKRALIEPGKLRDYLLSLSHPVGRYKAAVFHSMGYSQEAWQLLELDLREQHLTLEAHQAATHTYGTIYEILGELSGPSGRMMVIKSVWIVLSEEDFPRFVTAYPGTTP